MYVWSGQSRTEYPKTTINLLSFGKWIDKLSNSRIYLIWCDITWSTWFDVTLSVSMSNWSNFKTWSWKKSCPFVILQSRLSLMVGILTRSDQEWWRKPDYPEPNHRPSASEPTDFFSEKDQFESTWRSYQYWSLVVGSMLVYTIYNVTCSLFVDLLY